jgi:hypothetical protein
VSLGYVRRRRSHCREICGADDPEVPIRIERSPFAEMLGVRERLPDLCGGMMEVADENERPPISVFPDLSARSGTRRVLLTAVHVFPFLFLTLTEGTFSIFSKCCSRASTCFDQKRRKGSSHASSSMSGSGLSR